MHRNAWPERAAYRGGGSPADAKFSITASVDDGGLQVAAALLKPSRSCTCSHLYLLDWSMYGVSSFSSVGSDCHAPSDLGDGSPWRRTAHLQLSDVRSIRLHYRVHRLLAAETLLGLFPMRGFSRSNISHKAAPLPAVFQSSESIILNVRHPSGKKNTWASATRNHGPTGEITQKLLHPRWPSFRQGSRHQTAGHDYLPTPTAQDLIHDRIGDQAGLDDVARLSFESLAVRVNERSARKRRMDHRRLDLRALVDMLELLPQTFVEREQARLGCAVIDQVGHCHETRHAGCAHDVALFLRDHVRQECLDQVEVAQQVDVEQLAQVIRARIQYAVSVRNARIIDEYRRGAFC